MNDRERYLDTIKLLAAFWVYTTHFIATFNSDLFRYWSNKPTYYLLGGVTGKLAVAMFAVVLGYLASASGKRNKKNYIIKRYMYFVIAGFFINMCYLLLVHCGIYDMQIGLKDVLFNSFTIGSDIYVTFWCMRDFLLGSIICWLNGKYKVSAIDVLIEILIFCMVGKVWIAISLMGLFLALIKETKTVKVVFGKSLYRCMWIIGCWCVIKRPEGTLAYFIDGIACVIIILVVMYSKYPKKLLDNKVMSHIGKNVMEIFLIHVIVYKNIGKTLFESLGDISYRYRFILVFILCFICIVILSYPVKWILDVCNRCVGRMVDNLDYRIATIMRKTE